MEATYVGRTVTLTSADTNYNLLTLLRAIVPTVTATARELKIQSRTGNAGPIFIGDAGIDGNSCGRILLAAEALAEYRSSQQNIPLGSIFLRSSSPAQKVNVEVMAA